MRKIGFAALMSLLCSLLTVSCFRGNDPEGIVKDMYSYANDGKWSKILPYMVPDSIEKFNDKEKEQFEKLMNEVMPDLPLYTSYSIEKVDEEPDSAGNYNFTVKTAFPDGLTYVEEGVLKPDKDGKLKILLQARYDTVPGYKVTDFTKKSGELIRNLEYAYDLVLSARGLPEFQLKAAEHYEDSVFVATDLNKYFTLVSAAAEKGYPKAYNWLGYAYANGLGTEKNETKAFENYKKAAEAGVPGGMFKLAYCYDEGMGTAKDYPEAIKWYQKAADKGNVDAMINLSIMYYNGYGVDKDPQKAFELLLKAAEKGDELAMSNIGLKYENGNSPVQKDIQKAIEWYIKAAEKNNPIAADYLGNIYYFGRNGIPVDYSKAIYWYNKAVEIGDVSVYSNSKDYLAHSYFMLGECYELGRGTSVDRRKAKENFLKAAEFGEKAGEIRAKRL